MGLMQDGWFFIAGEYDLYTFGFLSATLYRVSMMSALPGKSRQHMLVEAVPLAPKPLSSPHLYDPEYEGMKMSIQELIKIFLSFF